MSHRFPLDFPYAYGAPEASARFRVHPDDFQVDEVAGFSPTREGEHSVLHIRKWGENTAWVAQQLARLAGVPERDVGYCGRKDRHANTSQWFSVHLPGRPEPDWRALNSDSIRILGTTRHNRKLRRGEHRGNRFAIRLRAVTTRDRRSFDNRLERILNEGAPNYFGEQRFGREAGNLTRAESLLVEGRSIRHRQQRSLALSAARSWLFNQVLAERVKDDNWHRRLSGDPGTSPSGPLWGRGRPLSGEKTLALESAVLEKWRGWCEGLEHVGLRQERRPLVLNPENPGWHWQGDDLTVTFSLPSGTFATAVLREVARLDSAAGNA